LSHGLNIEYVKRLDNIINSGNNFAAHFTDGTTATGFVLISCYGGHSKTRKYIVSAEAAKGLDTDYTMMYTWTRLPAETALAVSAKHPIISQSINQPESNG
jgi:2-polyprenyl-6-methoxyphenol hydroxylase-like FAD-dependent oxidoreductase